MEIKLQRGSSNLQELFGISDKRLKALSMIIATEFEALPLEETMLTASAAKKVLIATIKECNNIEEVAFVSYNVGSLLEMARISV